jgi:hypothetical protein
MEPYFQNYFLVNGWISLLNRVSISPLLSQWKMTYE